MSAAPDEAGPGLGPDLPEPNRASVADAGPHGASQARAGQARATPDPPDPAGSTRDANPGPDPALPEQIRASLADADDAALAYLALGARLDRVSAVSAVDGAVAWRSVHAAWDRPWIIAMGTDPRDVAACVIQLADRTGRPEGLTIDRAAFPRLPARLRPVAHWEWDWWWTRQAPPLEPGEERVVDLDPADPRIEQLLLEASPGAMAWPGDRRIRRWAGIEAGSLDLGSGGTAGSAQGSGAPPPDPAPGDPAAADPVSSHATPADPTPADPVPTHPTAAGPTPAGPTLARPDSGGRLVAVAAVTTMRPGIPHLSSVATAEPWRGRGLARALCARITRDELAAGAPAVTLGMHAGNRSARAVYAHLGFTVGYRWASGRL